MKNRTFSKKIISVFICVALVATLFLDIFHAPKASAMDGVANQDVTSLLSNITVDINNTDKGTVCVDDNVAKNPLYASEHYTMRISWKINSSNYNNRVESGDYFWLDISNDNFHFSDSNADYILEYDDGESKKVIGHWRITDNKIHFIFSDECEYYTEVSGYFEVTGTFTNTKKETATITLCGQPITVAINPTATGFPYEGAGVATWNAGIFSKLGTHYQGDDYIGWSLYVNYENAVKVANGLTATQVNNVVVKDTLPDDLIIEKVKFLTPINHPIDEDTLSKESAFKLELTNQMTRKYVSDFASPAEWEAYIESTPKTYGISEDNKTLIANLGNLPGSFQMASSKDAFRALLQANYYNFSTEELDALVDIYYGEDANPYSVYSVQLFIKAITSNPSGVFEKENYQNTATLTSDNESTSSTKALTVEKVDAGIQGATPKSATLTKKDAETGALIQGAKFKLQILNENTQTWSDYTPASGVSIKETDSNGKVIFENLDNGTYRFVETEAADNYDINSVQYSVENFTVNTSDTQGYEITATNAKLADNPTEDPTDNPDGNTPDGDDTDNNTPDDGDDTDNDTPDGDDPDNNTPDGDDTDNNTPDGDDPDENIPDGNDPDENIPDGDDPDENTPDGDDPDESIPDGDDPDENTPDGDDPDENIPDGDDPDESIPDGDDPDENTPDGNDSDDNNSPSDNESYEDSVVDTGDTTNLNLLFMLTIISAFTTVTTLILKIKRQRAY